MLLSSQRIKPNVQDLVIIQLDGIGYVIIASQMITLNVKSNSFIQPDNNKKLLCHHPASLITSILASSQIITPKNI
jgi:hypothetical protein